MVGACLGVGLGASWQLSLEHLGLIGDGLVLCFPLPLWVVVLGVSLFTWGVILFGWYRVPFLLMFVEVLHTLSSPYIVCQALRLWLFGGPATILFGLASGASGAWQVLFSLEATRDFNATTTTTPE